jgi:hypothetical protein
MPSGRLERREMQQSLLLIVQAPFIQTSKLKP